MKVPARRNTTVFMRRMSIADGLGGLFVVAHGRQRQAVTRAQQPPDDERRHDQQHEADVVQLRAGVTSDLICMPPPAPTTSHSLNTVATDAAISQVATAK